MAGHWTGWWVFFMGFALLFGVEEFRRLRAAPGDVRQGAPVRRRGTTVFVVAGALLLVFAIWNIKDVVGIVPAIVAVLAGLAGCYLVSWLLERVTAPPAEVVAPTAARAGMMVSLLRVGVSVLAGAAAAMAIKLAWPG